MSFMIPNEYCMYFKEEKVKQTGETVFYCSHKWNNNNVCNLLNCPLVD